MASSVSPFPGEERAEVQMALRIRRIDLDGLPVLGDGLIDEPPLTEDDAQPEVRLRESLPPVHVPEVRVHGNEQKDEGEGGPEHRAPTAAAQAVV